MNYLEHFLGSGEANFDALEANPFSSKTGRQEALVRGLLAKVPADLITLDPATVAQVSLPRGVILLYMELDKVN